MPNQFRVVGIPCIALAAALAVGRSTEPQPTCATDLALLERKLHLDYASYTLELRGDRLRAFTAMKSAAQLRADTTTGDACYFVLRDFVEWFHDPHLFIYENAALDTAETARRASAIDRRQVSEESARAYFRAHALTLDAIEGIWYDRGLRVAVLPDSTRGRNAFVAILLASDTSIWPAGAVRARITHRSDSSYDVLLSERNFALVHRRAQIFRHVLLRLSPGIWERNSQFQAPIAARSTRSTHIGRCCTVTTGCGVRDSVPQRLSQRYRQFSKGESRNAAPGRSNDHRPSRQRRRWLGNDGVPRAFHLAQGRETQSVPDRRRANPVLRRPDCVRARELWSGDDGFRSQPR